MTLKGVGIMIVQRRWPWIAQQNWQDILFIHTPVNYNVVREKVPEPIEVEKFDGTAWASIILFKATHSRLRHMPSCLSFPLFYQVNIRTYVKHGGEPGVYFFAVNTNSPLAKLAGRLGSMPFQSADLNMQTQSNNFSFQAKSNVLDFKVNFSPVSAPYQPKQDTLPYFLTERYCIWMPSKNNIVKAPILHSHWDLHDADVSIENEDGLPFPFPQKPIAHYAAFKHSMIHPYETFGKVSK